MVLSSLGLLKSGILCILVNIASSVLFAFTPIPFKIVQSSSQSIRGSSYRWNGNVISISYNSNLLSTARSHKSDDKIAIFDLKASTFDMQVETSLAI